MFSDLSVLQQFVYFTFIISLFSMIAGSIFFFNQKSELPKSYRPAAILGGVICLVAGMTYYFMKDLYLANALAGVNDFPTEYRYIDWIITVPLMLIKFPTLLGLGKRGQQFMLKLILASVAMLVTAFIGEVNFGNAAIHYGFYGVSCAFWFLIIFSLKSALSSLPPTITEAKRISIRRMFLFILIGWTIYPLGYLAPTFGLEGDYRELVYNIGDIINKVGLGLAVIAGGYRESKEVA